MASPQPDNAKSEVPRDSYGAYWCFVLAILIVVGIAACSGIFVDLGWVEVDDSHNDGISIFLVIGVVTVIATPLIIWSEYNYLSALRNEVDSSWHDIDVFFKRRASLIPELSTIVERFLKHEHGTLDAVMSARRQADTATSRTAKMDAELALSGALGRLLAVVEDYPQITTHATVSALQEQLVDADNWIAQSRLRYNELVKKYNTVVERFPTRFIAGSFGFAKAPYG